MKVLLNLLLFPFVFVWVYRWPIGWIVLTVAGIRWWDRLTF